jgi:hypothetical protein
MEAWYRIINSTVTGRMLEVVRFCYYIGKKQSQQKDETGAGRQKGHRSGTGIMRESPGTVTDGSQPHLWTLRWGTCKSHLGWDDGIVKGGLCLGKIKVLVCEPSCRATHIYVPHTKVPGLKAWVGLKSSLGPAAWGWFSQDKEACDENSHLFVMCQSRGDLCSMGHMCACSSPNLSKNSQHYFWVIKNKLWCIPYITIHPDNTTR